MKPFSLRFIKQDLELDYQQHKTKTHMKVLRRNLLFYGLLVFLFGIYSFILGQKFIGAVCFVYCLIFVPIIRMLASRCSKYFNIFCFTFQVIFLFAQPTLVMLGLNQEPIQDCESYLIGQASTYIALSLNLGSRFDLKCLAILINVIAQSMIIIDKERYTPLTIAWVGSNFLIVNYIYMHDIIEREAFLIKYNEKLWLKEIGSCAKICIITSVSEDGELQLDYNKCNSISQQEFYILDQNSYKIFLNSVILTPKDKFNSQILNDMRTPSKSKKFITLHNKIYKISEKTQIVNTELIGLFNNSVYDIKIFTTWNDQLLNIHVLMTKSLTQAETENTLRLKYERDIFAQYRKQFQTSIKKILIKLNLKDSTRYLQTVHGSIVSEVHNALRKSYNIQFFINPTYQKVKADFGLLPLLEQIKKITQSMPNQFNFTMKCYVNPEIRLISCQKTLFHILFNLLSIIVVDAKKSGYIVITAKQKLERIGACISFCIVTNVKSVDNLLDHQNYQQRLYGEEKGYKFDNMKAGLEMSVSEYLVGQIGPRRKIHVKDLSQDRLIIRFNIFQVLTCTNPNLILAENMIQFTFNDLHNS